MNAARTIPLHASFIVAALAAIGGCIKAPDLVIVDRRTALEEQAGGTFKGLSDELEQAGIQPGPVPYTRGELSAAGVPVGKGDAPLGPNEALDDSALLDELLVRRCVGEALDGTLVDTPKSCTAPIEPARQATLLERANRRRFQIWKYLGTKHPGTAAAEVRRAWRETHLKGVICGGQVEREGGRWEVKSC